MYVHNINMYEKFNSKGAIVTKQLLKNAKLATFCDAISSPYGLIENGAIAISNGKIEWVGPSNEIPGSVLNYETHDLQGRVVTPSLIDCHTHLVYGGNRAREFEMRLEGASYEDIARAGGGIISTVTATRALSVDELVNAALVRLNCLRAEGVTVVEVKSGYGLTIDDELKMLRAARALEKCTDITIKTTYLAAHAVPAEYKDRADQYITDVVLPGMDQGAREGLIDAVDAFCEGIAFSAEQVERVFSHAKKLGLDIKIHAEQLTNLGGTALASKYNALSADHLEFLDTNGIKAMQKSGTVAVLLPGAFYTLRETQYPPIAELRAHSIPIALATDCNPGSSPISSLLLILNMACSIFRLTPEEALRAVTLNGAKALGIDHEYGSIEQGKIADFAIWNIEHPAELSYRAGYNPLHKTIRGDLK